MILTMSQRKWKSYIRYLAERLSSLVGQYSHFPVQFPPPVILAFAYSKVQHEIACFSEVNHRSTPDYAFDFADCQTMELIQRKIRRCLSLMEAHADTISALIAYHRKIEQSIPDAANLPPAYIDDVTARLNECHKLNVQHTRNLKELLHSAESTRLLVCLLPLRNKHPAIQQTTNDSQNSSTRSSTTATTLSSTPTAMPFRKSHSAPLHNPKPWSRSPSSRATTPGSCALSDLSRCCICLLVWCP